MPRHGVERRVEGGGSLDGATGLALGAAAAALVGGLGAANGGYFPTSWGVPAVAAAVVAATVLLRRPAPAPGPLERLWLAALAAFAGWTALAAAWTDSVPRTVLELQRLLLYVVVVGALVVLGTRRSAAWIAGGVVGAAAVVSIWNLAVRATGTGPNRGDIARPLGYENGLAVLAAIGALLAVGLALVAPTRWLRVVAAAPVAVFVPMLAIVSSTGAWAACGVGVAATVALLLRSRAVWAVAAVLVVVGVIGVGLAGGRGNPRSEYWRAAWDEHRAAPWLGTGPGTYRQAWLRYRSNDRTTADAHSLYLQTLGEVGPFGLALLGAALLVPLAGAARTGRDPLAAGAAGAYATFLVHSGVDFDWQLPAVTVAGIASGAILLMRTRSPVPEPLTRLARAAGIAGAIAAAGFSAVTLVGNRAVTDSAHALASGDARTAAARARRAAALLPWDSRPWERLGFAQLAQGERTAAASSFRRAVRRDTHEAGLWADLAEVTSGDESRRASRQARMLDPRSKGG